VNSRNSIRTLRPVDWFISGYLGVTIVPLLLARGAGSTPTLLALHVAGILAILGARKFGLARTRIGDLILAFYPIPVFAFTYTEIGIIDAALHPGIFHDDVIQRIEEAWFGGHPSQDLYRRIDSRAVGTYLHLGYVCYYILAPVLMLTLWFTSTRERFDRAQGTISLAFFLSFLVFIAWPVAGPYHAFTPPPVDRLGWGIPHLARFIIDRGSSVGAAFPSSHVGVAVVIWIMAIRYQTILAVVYAFLVPALAVGAIYGGFHYAIDVVAGAGLGLLVGTLGHQVTRKLSNRISGSPSPARTAVPRVEPLRPDPGP
jgi:membrane-associated phospholipid phosphatase